jgi:DNA gyrase/topoisomerase IV subunit B
MLMPEASSHFDDFREPWQHDVRLAGEIGRVKTIAVTHSVHKPADDHFGDGIPRPDSPHVLRTANHVFGHGTIRHRILVLDHVKIEGKRDASVQRYKGLGEMNAEQLADTTMNPEKRTLLVVRLEDLVATDQIFTTLMGEDVESRRKFIEDNALDVKNLDV